MYEFAIGVFDRYENIINIDYSDIQMIYADAKGMAVLYTRTMGVINSSCTTDEIADSIERFIDGES